MSKELIKSVLKMDQVLFSNQKFIDSVDFNEKSLRDIKTARETIAEIRSDIKVGMKDFDMRIVVAKCMLVRTFFGSIVTKNGKRVRAGAKNK